MQCLDLNGQWTVVQAGKKERLPAQVPGCVHLDLLAAGKIPDPFFRDNEDSLQWIGRTDWIYARTFHAPASLLAQERVLLRCEGLDTLATVMVNGREIARTDNMFRTWEFDIRALLRAGRNAIEIRFASAEAYVAERQKQRYLHGWTHNRDIAGRPWLRKEPCNFGWDWGPVLVTCGIWRSIQIVAFNNARLTGVRIRQVHADGRVQLAVTPEIEALGAGEVVADIRVSLDGREVVRAKTTGIGALPAANLVLAHPQLWWPNGMGKQPLYTVDVTLTDIDGVALDALSRRIGLRTLRLDRHPDPWGESFQFVVNGVPFFAKGANWIPADAFVNRLDRERYSRLLHAAADANMNMLRLWGGGIYEQDAFYDLCDSLGICVWHDFMFACSTYPAFDKAFMKNVKAEAEGHVRRVRHHPCIALWCGNNELEQGLVGEKWTDRQMSWADYGKLFDKLLPEVVGRLDDDRDYWPCSPHSPHGDRREHWNPKWGDAHLWDVWHGRKPFEWYRTCEHRFNSEFGFQSFPEPRTVHGYTVASDRNVTSPVMEHHQRAAIGNTVIMQYLLDWFRLPSSFDRTLWLSQIQQGMAVKYAVEHWRRSMPRGMGTLYWQINDCWPVASWSSIDYHSRWKALHHMARRFYAPLLVSGVEDAPKGTVAVHVTSDRMAPASGVVSWTMTNLAGTVLGTGKRRIRILPRANQLVATVNAGKWLASHGPRDLLVWLQLEEGGTVVSANTVLFEKPKRFELPDPKISASVRQLDDGKALVTLKARRCALWVWLELEGMDADLSDNFFHLRPGQPATVVATPWRPAAAKQVARVLRVRSLVDTYKGEGK
jgi:beta-mannosidase